MNTKVSISRPCSFEVGLPFFNSGGISCSLHPGFFFLMIRRPPRSTLFPYTTSSDLGIAPRLARRRADLNDLLLNLRHLELEQRLEDRKSTRLNSSHPSISYAVFCLKKKKKQRTAQQHYKETKKGKTQR